MHTYVHVYFCIPLYVTDCWQYSEEIGNLELKLAEKEEFYQYQCGQQEKVEAMLRSNVDRWKKEALSYKSKLSGKYMYGT